MTRSKKKSKAAEKHQTVKNETGVLNTEVDANLSERKLDSQDTKSGTNGTDSMMKTDQFGDGQNYLGKESHNISRISDNPEDFNGNQDSNSKNEDEMLELLPPDQEEPATLVDQILAVFASAWKLWTVLGIIVIILAVFANVEVSDDEPEMLIIDKGVALSKSRARVFKYISDLSRYSEWYPATAKFEPTDATPMGVGKHFREVVEVPLFGDLHYNNLVTGYESPSYISFVSDSWMKLRIEIVLERHDTAHIPTSLKYRVYSGCKSYLFRFLGLPAIKLMYSNRARQAMLNLRFILH